MGYFTVWMTARVLRWALWISFLGYLLYVHFNRAMIFTKLNQLPAAVEISIFGLAVGAVTMGFLELAARERARLSRPPFLGMPKRAA